MISLEGENFKKVTVSYITYNSKYEYTKTEEVTSKKLSNICNNYKNDSIKIKFNNEWCDFEYVNDPVALNNLIIRIKN